MPAGATTGATCVTTMSWPRAGTGAAGSWRRRAVGRGCQHGRQAASGRAARGPSAHGRSCTGAQGHEEAQAGAAASGPASGAGASGPASGALHARQQPALVLCCCACQTAAHLACALQRQAPVQPVVVEYAESALFCELQELERQVDYQIAVRRAEVRPVTHFCVAYSHTAHAGACRVACFRLARCTR
jgi:hypothetical protein